MHLGEEAKPEVRKFKTILLLKDPLHSQRPSELAKYIGRTV